MMEARNPAYNEFGSIDCEVEHPRFGWIPYTANNGRGDPREQNIWDQCVGLGPAPYVPPPVSSPSASDVRAEGARRLSMVAASYPLAERETWHKQLAEAEAYSLSQLAATPLLDAYVASSGETKAQIVARIIANDLAFSAATGAILGAQRAILNMDPIPADYADDSRWP